MSDKDLFYRPSDERMVLSYCFKKIDYFYDLSAKLTMLDFLGSEHQFIYSMFSDFVDKGISTIDLPLVLSKAQSLGVLELIGGPKYVQSIANIEASPSNFEVYINNVLEASTKYKTYVALSHHMEDIRANAGDNGKSGAELISNIEAHMLDMSSRATINEEPILFGSNLEEFINERAEQRIKMSGISTGYPILDRQIDGLIPGTLMVVAARKKMGKSSFLTNIGLHVGYRSKIPVLYIDTELNYNEWQTRALSCISGVKERDIKHGGYNSEQRFAIDKARKLISTGKVFHKYMPGYSVEKVVSLCKKYKLRENIGLIIFDYLKEPDLSSTDGNRKEYQLLGDITTKLKDLSGVLNIPVLTAVQLNRQNDIADSDRIARYGDIISVWGLRTEEEKSQCGIEGGQYKLVIKDTRRGGSTPEQGIGFRFFKSRIHIREVAPHDQFFMSMGDEVSNMDDLEDGFFDGTNPYELNGAGDELK